MNRIHLAYHDSASGEASKLSQKLQAQGWQVFTSACGTEERGALADALKTFNGPTLLLINDGFLHNLNCQYGMLDTYRQIEARPHTHAVLASSMRSGPGNVQARVLTNLERVSDVIRYMNYWQNAYLLKRKELGSTSTPESAAKLKPHREVSQEIGEFLKLIRKAKPPSVYDLIDDDGTLLLKLLGTPPGTANQAPVQEEETPKAAENPQVEEVETPVSDDTNTIVADAGTEITAATSAAASLKESSPEVDIVETSEIQGTATTQTEAVTPPDLPQPEEADPVPPVEEVFEEVTTEYFPEKEPELVQEQEEKPETTVEAEPVSETKEEVGEPKVGKPKTEKNAPSEEPTLAEIAASKAKKSRKANTKELLHLIEEDELEDAYAFAESSLRADPGNAKLRYYYAVALLRAEDDTCTDAAVQELNKLVKSDFSSKAHLALGHVSLERRDYGMARRNLEAAYAIDKNVDSEVTYRLGALLQDEYYEDKKKAKKFLKKATKQSRFNVEDAWYRLAQLDLLTDKKKKAKKKLKKAINIGERHPFAAYDLASLYLREDNIGKANKYYQKAINANPELDTEANQAAFSLLRPVIEPEGFDASSGAFVAPKVTRETAKIGQLTVLITGASSGIGAATARVFAEHGHRLILTGRRVGNLRTLGAKLNKEFNVPIRLLSFDVTEFDATEQLLNTLPEGWNEIDVLINNAGKAKGLDFIHQGQLEHWEEMIDTNIKGLLYMIRLVAPQMVERKHGHIINVCSTAGHEVYPKGAVYCATKHAVDAITQGARLDLHSHGIRVSQVSPAHVEETEFAAVRFDGDTAKAEKVYENFQPLRARDVAMSIYYIAAQPEHVNVQDVLMLSTQQANSTTIDRSGR